MNNQEQQVLIELLQRIVEVYTDTNIKRHARGLLLAIFKL